ncbi:bifunctional DNA primase/polymerase [Cryobacterium sp. TMS1-13-1]|uniref:bifunctional DNA primase/polymerase n=1 Tax=Cryobacterium sp. TMS1-13-1 TaxID=1259220 RepID=UPI001A7E1C1A|nr:bifunctional DNA primase/polymerase [Cryobacterium sp. TMS1-13-1]
MPDNAEGAASLASQQNSPSPKEETPAQKCFDSDYIADQGISTLLRFLPLRPGTNRPWLTEWPKRASADHDVIQAWRHEFPRCNWGILTGDGIGVLDVDCKPNLEEPWSFQGFASLIDVEELLGIDLSNLPLVQTASGAHLYFRYSGRLDSKVPWVPHLDVKADGGHQVAAPGTIRDGVDGERVYTLLRGDLRDIPFAPEALLRAIQGWRINRSGLGGGSPSPRADLPSTEEAITNGLPLSSRNDYMHRLGCRWWLKLGLDAEAEVWVLARLVWEATPGQDSFPWSEVEKAVHSARGFIDREDYINRQFITAWLYREGLA